MNIIIENLDYNKIPLMEYGFGHDETGGPQC